MKQKTCKRIKLDSYLTPYTKTNQIGIIDPNIRAKTVKPTKVKVSGLGLGNGHLKTQKNKE